MKTQKWMIVVPLILFFVASATAKTQKIGIYLTVQDYLDHKLSYTNSDKIKVIGLLGSHTVVISQDGKKQVLPKSEIFGYNEDGVDYRFFNNQEYRIISEKGLFIYTHTTLVQQGKGPKPTEQYFFSAKPVDFIRPLTITNVLTVYANKPSFTYAVEGFFKNDYELAEYDTHNKLYKLAYLYTQNIN